MVQKDLLEGEDGRLKARLVRRQVRGQSASVGARVDVLFRDHLDLLADSTLHDDVVAIEPELTPSR